MPANLFGFTNAALVGTHLKLILPPERHGEIQERLDSIKGQEVRVNEVGRRHKIREEHLGCVVEPTDQVRSRDGERIAFVGNDVTRR